MCKKIGCNVDSELWSHITRIENVFCEVDSGKEILKRKDYPMHIIKEDGTNYFYYVDIDRRIPIENWRLECKCADEIGNMWAHNKVFFGKGIKGNDIFLCTRCGKRFLPCSFCRDFKPPFVLNKERLYSPSCYGCVLKKMDESKKARTELEKNMEIRKKRVLKGEMSRQEEVLQNLIDDLAIGGEFCLDQWELLFTKNNKAVFYQYNVHDLHGYKTVVQNLLIYAIGTQMESKRTGWHVYHHSNIGCVSTGRDYFGGIEIKSIASIFASNKRCLYVKFNDDETKLIIRWFDGTEEEVTV